MNNKLIAFSIGVALVALLSTVFALAIFVITQPTPTPQPFLAGAGPNFGIRYSSSTNTSIICPGATSTQIIGRTDGRVYFNFSVNSSTNITLCKAGVCLISQGYNLNGSGGNFEQKADDLYNGPYSCIGNGASSTAGVVYNQL